jgi:hypothetical protein
MTTTTPEPKVCELRDVLLDALAEQGLLFRGDNFVALNHDNHSDVRGRLTAVADALARHLAAPDSDAVRYRFMRDPRGPVTTHAVVWDERQQQYVMRSGEELDAHIDAEIRAAARNVPPAQPAINPDATDSKLRGGEVGAQERMQCPNCPSVIAPGTHDAPGACTPSAQPAASGNQKWIDRAEAKLAAMDDAQPAAQEAGAVAACFVDPHAVEWINDPKRGEIAYTATTLCRNPDATATLPLYTHPTPARATAGDAELADRLRGYADPNRMNSSFIADMHQAAALAAAPGDVRTERLAIRMLVAAGFVTEAKANEALNIAHGFATGPLEAAPGDVQVPFAYATHHDTPMLYLTHAEAAAYCNDDEQPIPLYAPSADSGRGG